MTSGSNWRIEHHLLCACARRRAVHPVVRLPAGASIDWASFMRLADWHEVTDLLLSPLRAATFDVPRELVDALDRRLLEKTAENLARTTQLVALLELFRGHGIRALAFKGPTLAAGIYGHLGLRNSADLDILVDRRHASRVRPLMLRAGYTLPPREDQRCGSLLYGLLPAAGRDDTLVPGNPHHAAVDIHVGFAFWTQGIRLDPDGLFDRATTVDVAGHPVLTLCPDDLLLVLAIHGMMHGWCLLRFVTDV